LLAKRELPKVRCQDLPAQRKSIIQASSPEKINNPSLQPRENQYCKPPAQRESIIETSSPEKVNNPSVQPRENQ
jgi:hypothetical protein